MKQCARCGEWAADRSRFCPECGARLSAALAVEEGRKVLTVIFADVVGSTALGERIDAEKLRWAMQRWFHAMRRAVERHGGTIEDYRGDGVMAVFGIPAAHEDDALRAARAALDMRAAGQDLHAEVGVELRVRIGLNTGAAATGSSADVGTFTTGDVVNVAARLEQSAQPGEILLGARTYGLIAHAVEAEPLGPLEVRGRRDAVTAYRLVGVAASAPVRPRRAGASLVDRDDERARLVRAFERTGSAGACELCAVVGSPGVGKSRLVEEVAGGFADRATVAFGRCLPYGETLPWWPLVEALGGLIAQLGDDHPALPRAAELLDPGGRPVPPDEAQWVLRVVLERLARQRPFVLAIDDLQWADEAFLDLLDHLTEAVRDAPLLLLATARPELLDDRPAWRAQSLALDPLPDRHAGELLHRLSGAAPISPEVRRRILDVAEGYPLFVTELVAMVQDEGEALTEVPATIQALLAARLDRLAPDERALLGAAAVEGKAFRREHVRALLREPSVDNTLAELVRKGLIERDGDGYRFHHQLIRDAAYEALAKRTRADLHERLAAALEPRLAPGTGDELLGYHRERAVLLRRDLGETDAATARRAADNLADAARRAAQREDAAAAVALLERALALVPDDRTLLPALGAALFEGGRMADAIAVLDDAIATASDPETRARAGVEREFVRLEADAVEGTARALAVADAALIALADCRCPRAGVVAACPGALVRRQRRARRRRVGARGRAGAKRGGRARDGRDPRLAGDRGRARPARRRRRDRALRGVPAAARRQPRRGRADGQPARLAARHARRPGRRRAPPRRGQRGAARADRRGLRRLAPRGAGAAAVRAARAGRGDAAARAGPARGDGGPGPRGHHGGDARAGAVRAGPLAGSRGAVHDRAGRPPRATTSSRR